MRRLALALLLLPLGAAAQPADSAAVAAVLGPALSAAGLDAGLALFEAEMGADGFDRDATRAEIVGWLAARTPLDTARAFAAWTARPEVAPFLAWERGTAAPDFEDRLDAFWDGVDALDPEREAWTMAFLDRARYVNYAARLGVATLVALGAAIEAEERGAPLTAAEEAELAATVRAEVDEEYRAAAEVELFDVYYAAFAAATPAQLDAFFEAVEEPAAQWYYRRMPDAVEAAYGAALRRVFAEE